MRYLDYEGEPLKLEVSVRNRDRSTFIYVETVSRTATHILLYKRERGARGNIAAQTALSPPHAEYDCDSLLHRQDRQIAVEGAFMEYGLFPAVLRDGDFYVDKRAVCRLEAGEKVELAYSVMREKVNSRCEKLTVTLINAKDMLPPYENLYYKLAELPHVKYPLDRTLMSNNRFSVFTPKGYRIIVDSLDSANIVVREIKETRRA